MNAPERLGPYRVLTLVGRGGMGEVFRGRHLELGVERAIKVLTGRITPARAARFEREALALARINHPNVVRIHEVGQTPTGELFYAMDLVEGMPLDEFVAREPRSLEQALELMIEVARAVDALHTEGLVHRDLKPQNVMIRADGSPVVLDLGLAFTLDSDSRLTKTGAMVGTPYYMAPEQAGGARPTPAADVFSLGLMTWELVTGRSVTELDALPAYVSPPPPSWSATHLPLALDDVLAVALAAKPAERFQRAGDLADALAASGGGWTRRGRRLAVFGWLGLVSSALCAGAVLIALSGGKGRSAASPSPLAPSLTPAPTLPRDLGPEARAAASELAQESDFARRYELAARWLVAHPEGAGREPVLELAREAETRCELAILPGPSPDQGAPGSEVQFLGPSQALGLWGAARLALWEISEGPPVRVRLVREASFKERPIGRPSFAPDPQRGRAILHFRDRVEWWSAKDEPVPAPLSLPPCEIGGAIALGPKGELLALGRGERVLLASAAGGRGAPQALVEARGGGHALLLCFSPEGEFLFVVWGPPPGTQGQSHRIERVRLSSGEPRGAEVPLFSQANWILPTEAGGVLIAHSDGQISIWKPEIPGYQAPYRRLELSSHRPLSHLHRVRWLGRVAGSRALVSLGQARDGSPMSEFALWKREGALIRAQPLPGNISSAGVSPSLGWLVLGSAKGFALRRLPRVPE